MNSNINSHEEYLKKRLHQKIDSYLKTGAIEVLNDNETISIEYHFSDMGFPRRVEDILWEIVPNSEYYMVKIPTRPEESQDFTARIIQKYNLKGPIILYGDYLLLEEYRMDISLLPSVLWSFIHIPICLYAVNLEQKWCFSFNSEQHLNFAFAQETAPTK